MSRLLSALLLAAVSTHAAEPDYLNPAARYVWGDVRDAFRYYLKHYNKGRPFIVAGHSQGAAHIERWLKEFGADRALARRLVAAYPIGIGYTVGQLARLPGGRGACRTPTETGCIVTWNAFASDATPQAFIASTQARYEKATGKTPDIYVCQAAAGAGIA